MSSSKEYGGLDYFRIIAAALVVAIHTSPLSIINDRADFIFTRILCRIAVPFFFMVSGFFLYADNRR
ncbi:MAG: acyltransferase, partial [Clostridiales bacterium]|nr:acyltransferase [Clostridiales bacterium]